VTQFEPTADVATLYIVASPALEELPSSGTRTAAPPVGMRRIEPSRGFVPIDASELWRYRELLYRLVWRDIKARYKQTLLGPVWAILRPFASMVIMAAVFGGLAGFKSGSNVPYPLFLYSGLLVWTYFSSAITGSSSSLLNYGGMLGKAYFPRLYAPFAAVTAPLVDFALALLVVFGLFGYYGRWPSWHVVFLPAFILLAGIAGLGVGIWLCGVSVRFRDVPFTLPYLIQIWFYATPILYPVSRLPRPFSTLLVLNPMAAVVDGFRWSLLGISPPNILVVMGSSTFAALLAGAGLFFFRRTERTIMDMV
jgi:lipopolysaccharide transport system permease protein